MWEVPGGINDGWLRDWGPTVSIPVGCCLAKFWEGTQSEGLAAWREATLSEDTACDVICCCCAVWAVSFQSWLAVVAHWDVLPLLHCADAVHCALSSLRQRGTFNSILHGHERPVYALCCCALAGGTQLEWDWWLCFDCAVQGGRKGQRGVMPEGMET